MQTPVLIIGSGLAGLITAYRLAEKGIPSTVVTKSAHVLEGSNSVYAQGGIVYTAGDADPADLIEDVLKAGDFINDKKAVEQLATDGVALVERILLQQVQVPFDREDGHYSLTQEAAHSHPRILHVKDSTGRAIMESLWEKVQQHELVQILEGYVLVDLLTSGHNCRGYRFKYRKNRCLGAYLYHIATGKVHTVKAEQTVLCTGGLGQLYEYHTNADHAYGSGLAVANRAKVRIINARFVQFHPTALWTPHKGRRFLISEALRGEGARLMNRKGEYFMQDYPQKDLESRAVVSQAIMEQLLKNHDEYVYLDIARNYKGTVPLEERFPAIYQQCLKEGIDINRDPIPVVPAEHFFCGGLYVDLDGQTELPGLFAAGEVACTGVHGANRLASTSLLECLTWGVKSADAISRIKDKADLVEDNQIELQEAFDLLEDWQSFGDQQCDLEDIEREKERIRRIMWSQVGILRTREGLLQAKEELRNLWKNIDARYSRYALSEPLIELRHMIEAAYLVTLSASSHTSLKEDTLGGHVLVSGNEE